MKIHICKKRVKESFNKRADLYDKKTLLLNLENLLNDKNKRFKQVQIGMKRMGKSGASKKIVDYINLSLLT